MQNQIKTNDRVKNNGEVFTAKREVVAMVNMVKSESYKIDSTFLEPACGNGNFLVEILHKKLDTVFRKAGNNPAKCEFLATRAFSTIYGIDIMDDNIMEAQQRLYNEFFTRFVNQYQHQPSQDCLDNIQFILSQNIQCGDTLADTPDLIMTKWSFGRSNNSYRTLFTYIDMVATGCSNSPLKFDVIIGNPPFQAFSTDTSSKDMPLYHKFVAQAKQLSPHYLVMLIPSRWFAGGIGLNKFRDEMLNDPHICKMVDFPDAKECFPENSIGGGVCYFLWDREYEGDCLFSNVKHGTRTTLSRNLNEFPVFVRYNQALKIIHKVQNLSKTYVTDIASTLDPYGILAAEGGSPIPMDDSLKLYSSKGIGYIPKTDLLRGHNLLPQYHVMLSKTTSEHALQSRKDGTYKVTSTMGILNPNEICTISYFLIGSFHTEAEASNLLSYMKTKFFRFLLLQAVSSINLSRDKFQFVPIQDFSKPWTDGELYIKYGLDSEEIEFIESLITTLDLVA